MEAAIAALSSDELGVAHEDVVFAAVAAATALGTAGAAPQPSAHAGAGASVPATDPVLLPLRDGRQVAVPRPTSAADAAALWATVRLSWLSPGTFTAAASTPGVPPTALADARRLRAARAAWHRRHPRHADDDSILGSSVLWEAEDAAPGSPPLRFRDFPPRHAYAFTVRAGDGVDVAPLSGLGAFFVWLDRTAPTANNNPFDGGRHALPPAYAGNIHSWSAASPARQHALVLNGAQALAAIRQASSHPEFATLGQPAVRGGSGGDGSAASGQRPPSPPISAVATGPTGLHAVYLHYASSGEWIKCVDMARIAIVWLMGRGTAYLDTDVWRSEADTPLPPQVTAARALLPGAAPSASLAGPPLLPLLILAQDADGLIQNNLVAATASHHPFLTLALHAMYALSPAAAAAFSPRSPAYARSVLHATGPVLLTALHATFGRLPVTATPTLASTLGVAASPRLLASVAIASAVRISAVATEAVDVAHDARLAAALPAPWPEAVFASLAHAATLLCAPPPVPATAGAAPPAGLAGLALARAAVLAHTVHLCPPTTLYPTHWREGGSTAAGAVAVSPAMLDAAGSDGGDGAAATPHELAVLRSLRDRAAGAVRYGAHSWDCTWLREGDAAAAPAAADAGHTGPTAASRPRRGYGYGYGYGYASSGGAYSRYLSGMGGHAGGYLGGSSASNGAGPTSWIGLLDAARLPESTLPPVLTGPSGTGASEATAASGSAPPASSPLHALASTAPPSAGGAMDAESEIEVDVGAVAASMGWVWPPALLSPTAIATRGMRSPTAAATLAAVREDLGADEFGLRPLAALLVRRLVATWVAAADAAHVRGATQYVLSINR